MLRIQARRFKTAVRAVLPLLLGVVALVIPAVSLAACRPTSDPVRAQIGQIARPYLFDLNRWESKALIGKLKPEGIVQDRILEKTDLESYFKRAQAVRREPGLLESEESRLVERTLQVWISQELNRNGITCPLDAEGRFPAMFPPLLFKVEQLPSVLVISPRERIELVQRSTLRTGLNPLERGRIEVSCDALGVSSLVDDIAGIATFPAMVTPDFGIRNTLETASEEWLHQYLAFTPLGFRYLEVIDGSSDQDMVASLNETLVGMVSAEIAAGIMLERFPDETASPLQLAASSGFSFNKEMRITRLKVDELLAGGEVGPAEGYMEQRRQLFLKNGYYLRKLNQAYFAFHGTYAYGPASTSPVFENLQKWRARCGSLRVFFVSTSRMTGFSQLQKTLEES